MAGFVAVQVISDRKLSRELGTRLGREVGTRQGSWYEARQGSWYEAGKLVRG